MTNKFEDFECCPACHGLSVEKRYCQRCDGAGAARKENRGAGDEVARMRDWAKRNGLYHVHFVDRGNRP